MFKFLLQYSTIKIEDQKPARKPPRFWKKNLKNVFTIHCFYAFGYTRLPIYRNNRTNRHKIINQQSSSVNKFQGRPTKTFLRYPN